MTKERKAVIDKLFSLFNFKKQMDFSDPDYEWLETETKEIPDHRMKEFYMMVVSNKKYQTKQGILIRGNMSDAIKDFTDMLSDEVWKERKVKEKSVKLQEKISSMQEHNFKHMKEQELINFFQDKDLSKFKNKETGQAFFSDAEIEVMEHGEGIVSFLNKASTHSHSELAEFIEISFKNYITKELLKSSVKEEPIMIGGNIKLPEPKRM